MLGQCAEAIVQHLDVLTAFWTLASKSNVLELQGTRAVRCPRRIHGNSRSADRGTAATVSNR